MGTGRLAAMIVDHRALVRTVIAQSVLDLNRLDSNPRDLSRLGRNARLIAKAGRNADPVRRVPVRRVPDYRVETAPEAVRRDRLSGRSENVRRVVSLSRKLAHYQK
jgi:hypothetical protein